MGTAPHSTTPCGEVDAGGAGGSGQNQAGPQALWPELALLSPGSGAPSAQGAIPTSAQSSPAVPGMGGHLGALTSPPWQASLGRTRVGPACPCCGRCGREAVSTRLSVGVCPWPRRAGRGPWGPGPSHSMLMGVIGLTCEGWKGRVWWVWTRGGEKQEIWGPDGAGRLSQSVPKAPWDLR